MDKRCWSRDELLVLEDLIAHAQDFATEDACAGNAVEARAWQRHMKALIELRDGRMPKEDDNRED